MGSCATITLYTYEQAEEVRLRKNGQLLLKMSVCECVDRNRYLVTMKFDRIVCFSHTKKIIVVCKYQPCIVIGTLNMYLLYWIKGIILKFWGHGQTVADSARVNNLTSSCQSLGLCPVFLSLGQFVTTSRPNNPKCHVSPNPRRVLFLPRNRHNTSKSRPISRGLTTTDNFESTRHVQNELSALKVCIMSILHITSVTCINFWFSIRLSENS